MRWGCAWRPARACICPPTSPAMWAATTPRRCSPPRPTPRDHSLVLVDIGTNTEISLVHGGQIYTCSTASGPAFEGAHIKDGMRAAPGAIEAVHIRPDGGVSVGTIGRIAAVGICGSGILQGIAEMVDAGIIDMRGVLDRAHPRVRSDRHNG